MSAPHAAACMEAAAAPATANLPQYAQNSGWVTNF